MFSKFNFPVTIEPNGEGGYIASFRDVPEALTEAPSLEDIKTAARDALITAIDFYIEDRRKFPAPSEPREGEFIVALPPSVEAKVLLLNAMVEANIRPSDLAKRMGISRQEVTRITDLHHATKIDTIGTALNSIGRRLELAVA